MIKGVNKTESLRLFGTLSACHSLFHKRRTTPSSDSCRIGGAPFRHEREAPGFRNFQKLLVFFFSFSGFLGGFFHFFFPFTSFILLFFSSFLFLLLFHFSKYVNFLQIHELFLTYFLNSCFFKFFDRFSLSINFFSQIREIFPNIHFFNL